MKKLSEIWDIFGYQRILDPPKTWHVCALSTRPRMLHACDSHILHAALDGNAMSLRGSVHCEGMRFSNSNSRHRRFILGATQA